MPLTAAEVGEEFGELPDDVVAAIVRLGVTRAQLVEARARLQGVEEVDRREPSPDVEQVMRLLTQADWSEEEVEV